jgi:hypothetical protein
MVAKYKRMKDRDNIMLVVGEQFPCHEGGRNLKETNVVMPMMLKGKSPTDEGDRV